MFGALGTLLGKAANTVHNDVVTPINRDIVQPAHSLVWANGGGALRSLLGNPQEKAGTQALQSATQRYGFTPAFNQLIAKAHPIVTPNLSGGDVGQETSTKSRGPFTPWNGIKVQQGSGNYALLHEGLHDAFAHQTPQMKQNFYSALQSAVNDPNGPTVNEAFGANAAVGPQSLRADLNNSLSSYPGYAGIDSLNNIQTLPQNLQNEIHSFVPQFYQNAQKPFQQPLANYYSQYFNPSSITKGGN